jgi:DMSO/TMAO reductase YedYZ heme-binding membrane subunit
MRSGKQNFAEVWLYGILLTALMAARLPFFTRRARRAH